MKLGFNVFCVFQTVYSDTIFHCIICSEVFINYSEYVEKYFTWYLIFLSCSISLKTEIRFSSLERILKSKYLKQISLFYLIRDYHNDIFEPENLRS